MKCHSLFSEKKMTSAEAFTQHAKHKSYSVYTIKCRKSCLSIQFRLASYRIGTDCHADALFKGDWVHLGFHHENMPI